LKNACAPRLKTNIGAIDSGLRRHGRPDPEKLPKQLACPSSKAWTAAVKLAKRDQGVGLAQASMASGLFAAAKALCRALPSAISIEAGITFAKPHLTNDAMEREKDE